MSKSSKKKLSCDHPKAVQDASYRLGFMLGEFAVPVDFDQMGEDEIARLFVPGYLPHYLWLSFQSEWRK